MAKGNKTGGRKRGSLNKRSVEAIEIFGEFCPLEKILEKLKEPSVKANEELYLGTCLKLMKFKFPERKAVDHRAEIELIKEEMELLSDEDLIKRALELTQALQVEVGQ